MDVHSSYPTSYIHFTLNLQVLEFRQPEPLFPQRSRAASDRARGRPLGKYTIDAGFAHLVVTFWVDEKSHVGIEIASRFADGADVFTVSKGEFKSGIEAHRLPHPTAEI